MQQLFDSLTPTQRVTGALLLFFSVLVGRILIPLVRSLTDSFKPVLPPAIILVHGPSSANKSAIISAIISRFEHSHRAFLSVSLNSLSSMLTPSQFRRFFAPAFTAQGAAALNGLHRAWRALLDAENNLIVDYNFVSEKIFRNFLQAFPIENIVLVVAPSGADSLETSTPKDFPGGPSLTAFDGFTTGQIVRESLPQKAAQTVAVRLAAMGLL